jgi:RNA polymerase-interacting CarD/CdnL/TRCF family regulator
VTTLRLAVGDRVVYGAHGAGTIVARTTRMVGGEQQESIVLSLAGALSIELPLARAEETLRPVADEAELRRLEKVLAARAEPSDVPWLKRRNDTMAKLATTTGLAEIISDTASRTKAGKALSPSEHELSRRASDLLSNEIALARSISPDEANRWIMSKVG